MFEERRFSNLAELTVVIYNYIQLGNDLSNPVNVSWSEQTFVNEFDI